MDEKATPLRTLLLTGLLLAATLVAAGQGAPPQNAATAASPPGGRRGLIENYGIVYPYPPGLWTEDDRPAIRERLSALRGLEVDTVLQVFASRPDGRALHNGWLIFLDEAERAGIQVIARVYPADERAWYGFRMKTIRRFLSVTGQHSALLAYLGLHEPFESYTSRQLQRFFRAMKTIAPAVPVAHILGDVAAFDRSIRFPRREFAPGICDLCIISYYPAQSEAGRDVFDEESLRTLVQENRTLVSARDPGAQIWLFGQAFAQANPDRSFRMPSPEEMQAIFTAAHEEGADGFLWYPWIHDAYDQVLGDPSSRPQQEAVRQIALNHPTPEPADRRPQ
ncbi:MAG TPA: hypothetical protein VFF68_10225 [Anaerolineaceae bacterium]|nr:hypothetical protein [Anaerolineaceae bacterium]